MSDINTYANDLMIEFLDAAHDRIRSALKQSFGDTWLRDGVERHLNRNGLARAREMLSSPMAVVDMGKADEDLYGVEHLSNIVLGNWKVFETAFVDRKRTEVYFGEVAELRHNLSHRRRHHMLERKEVLRFARNAQMLLSAFKSPISYQFDAIAASLEQGGSPWGSQLGGSLPPAMEIVPDFVGRQTEMTKLSIWFTSNQSQKFLIWGYGGSGKSALAYQFARAVQDGASPELQAVVWLSAKAREFIEGETRSRRADFDSVESFATALWINLYGTEPSEEQQRRQSILRELTDTPALVVVDDLDTILNDEDLAHFILFELPTTASKIIYTSRQRIPGVPRLDVGGFDDTDLGSFIRSRASEYDLDVEQCLSRIRAIRSVTDAFPLFVDDLLRQALLDGLARAIDDWSQRKGDAAREYALRRQLSELGEPARRALIGVVVAERPVSTVELATISGYTGDDVRYAINDLLGWRLLNPQGTDARGDPLFSCNNNTRRLTQKTYGRDPVYPALQQAYKSLAGSPLPAALRRVVGSTISIASQLVIRGDIEGAAETIRGTMNGDLEHNSDLWGTLGWVLSRRQGSESVIRARRAFERSHALGSRKEDTYVHWIQLESMVAEWLVRQADDEGLLERWREASAVAEKGIARCGDTPLLCQAAAYLRTREAKTLERLMQFAAAQGCYTQGARWARRALETPNPSSREVSRSALYRSLLVALDGAGDPNATVRALFEWRAAVGSDDYEWRRERDRLGALSEYDGLLLRTNDA